MTDNKVKAELDQLISMGRKILYAGVYKIGDQEFDEETEKYLKKLSKEIPDYRKSYHVWYARAFRCVRSLLPERLDEFEEFYKGKKNTRKLEYFSAGITHFFQDIVSFRGLDRQDYSGKFASGLQQQINIIEAIKDNIDEVLFKLESEIHYGIFKSEIDVASELKKHRQLRAAGAVAGVVIEEHLKLTCSKNNIKFRKKNPSISDYNEALKKENIIDIVMWRLITRSGDIRNYCVHSKERDPTADEIDDIIRSAEKIIAEVS